MRSLAAWTAGVLLWIPLWGFSMGGDTEEGPDEYEVKAVFLAHFTRFVEWPAGAFPDEDSPFVLAVMGADPFGSRLDEVFRDVEVNGRKVSIRRLPRWEDLEDPAELRKTHILFVPSTEASAASSIVRAVRGSPVLAVGEEPFFARLGGTVNFYMDQSRVRFEVNLATVERSSLQVSSRMLRLARIIR